MSVDSGDTLLMNSVLPLYAPAVSGIVMLALAGWLLWLSAEQRQARAFALLLTIRGFSLIVLTVSPTATNLSLVSLVAMLKQAFGEKEDLEIVWTE